MPLLLAFGAQFALGESCSYESGFALPLCDTKGAVLFSLPPWFLGWLLFVFRRSGGCVLRMLRSRSLVLSCVHVGGFVYDARARLLCFFALFRSVRRLVLVSALSVWSCSVFSSFVVGVPMPPLFLFVCLFLLLLCFCYAVFRYCFMLYVMLPSYVVC